MNRKIIQPIVSAFLIIFAFLLNMKLADGVIFGDYLLETAGLPAMSNGNSGFHITGLIVVAAFLLGVILFRQFFNKYKSKFGQRLFIGLIIFVILFQPAYNTAVWLIKSQYPGLQSIEYNKADSICSYSLTPEGDYIDCSCTLKFINYSNGTQEFQVRPKLLEEQIEDSLRKYFNVNVTDLEYVDGEHFMSLPPAQMGTIFGPPVITTGLVFRFKRNDKSWDTNGTGSINGPSITIFNSNDTKSFK